MRAVHPGKRLVAAVAALLKRVRARCRRGDNEWPVTLLHRDEIQHICLVARRGNFLTLRRRIQNRRVKVRLACPSCAERAHDHGDEEVLANDETNCHAPRGEEAGPALPVKSIAHASSAGQSRPEEAAAMKGCKKGQVAGAINSDESRLNCTSVSVGSLLSHLLNCSSIKPAAMFAVKIVLFAVQAPAWASPALKSVVG